MRIGFFVLSMHNGGAERVAALLTNVWNGLGHDVVLLTQTAPTDREFAHSCVAREQVDLSALDDKAMASLKTRHRLEAVVFNDGIDAPAFAMNVQAARKAGCWVIIILHHTFNNWCYTMGNFRELGYGRLMSQVDAVVAVEDILALWWCHRGARAFHIPNPVAYQPIDHREMPQGKDLVWIGRIGDFAKRPELAIAAFARIHEAEPSARLFMLGTQTRRLVRQLLKDVPKSVLQAIVFTGFVANADDYLRRARVNLFTSLTEVAVPQVVREAQSLGVPTVALSIPPFANGVGGVVVVDDVPKMAERALVLLADDSANRRLGDEGLRESRVQARSSEVAERWERLLSALPNGQGLQSLEGNERERLQTVAVYDKLLAEVHAGDVCFTTRRLPSLLHYLKWRKRLNPFYLAERVVARIRRRV